MIYSLPQRFCILFGQKVYSLYVHARVLRFLWTASRIILFMLISLKLKQGFLWFLDSKFLV